MAAMFGQCLSLVTNCLYGEGGGEWGGPVPPIPASQRIPEVILDTTTMGHEAVVVKNGLRLCGTGSARGSAPILQVGDSDDRIQMKSTLIFTTNLIIACKRS